MSNFYRIRILNDRIQGWLIWLVSRSILKIIHIISVAEPVRFFISEFAPAPHRCMGTPAVKMRNKLLSGSSLDHWIHIHDTAVTYFWSIARKVVSRKKFTKSATLTFIAKRIWIRSRLGKGAPKLRKRASGDVTIFWSWDFCRKDVNLCSVGS